MIRFYYQFIPRHEIDSVSEEKHRGGYEGKRNDTANPFFLRLVAPRSASPFRFPPLAPPVPEVAASYSALLKYIPPIRLFEADKGTDDSGKLEVRNGVLDCV